MDLLGWLATASTHPRIGAGCSLYRCCLRSADSPGIRYGPLTPREGTPLKAESRSDEGARGRRGGRTSRAASRLLPSFVGPAEPLRRTIPTYELLDEDDLVRLEEHSDWILDEIGVEIHDGEALDLFGQAGARVDGQQARFEPGLVRSLCATAPPVFQMFGRDPTSGITVGGDSVVFTPAYGPPFVSDLEGGRRYATIIDFKNFVKLAQLSPWMHHSGGTICEPVDLPVNKRHLDMVYAHLRYSTKPFMGSVTSAERAEDSIQMARICYGTDYLEENCVIQGNINVNSPLVFDGVMVDSLKAYARANQGCVISPFILGGAMGPVTQPALVAQAMAEAMVGIALTQLIRPGSPMVLGVFLTTMNLRTGAPTFGTPEANLATYAIGQLVRRLDLPLRVGGHLTSSKVLDAQAAQESGDTMLVGLQAGANFVLQAAGWLEGGLVIGYEKFVFDLDRCGSLSRMLTGLVVDDNTLAADAFREAGVGTNFLGVDHTMANFETANYQSDLADDTSFEQWSDAGSLDSAHRANLRWKEMLADYRPPPFDQAVDEALRDFMDSKKASDEDRWY